MALSDRSDSSRALAKPGGTSSSMEETSLLSAPLHLILGHRLPLFEPQVCFTSFEPRFVALFCVLATTFS
ncbi:hypothetical protein GBA52_028336 [Prunus armeniaca]|nr:hypothetical protein GBA52_028336 [Prunus armeniaca]